MRYIQYCRRFYSQISISYDGIPFLFFFFLVGGGVAVDGDSGLGWGEDLDFFMELIQSETNLEKTMKVIY